MVLSSPVEAAECVNDWMACCWECGDRVEGLFELIQLPPRDSIPAPISAQRFVLVMSSGAATPLKAKLYEDTVAQTCPPSSLFALY